MRKIHVLLADDHAVLRAGLRLLVDGQRDMKVVAEATHGEEAVRTASETKPDVVILDLAMPGGGMEPIKRLLRLSPSLKVLVLTMYDDPAYTRLALAAGATGYVVKKAADQELLSAIRAVHKGRTFVNVSVAVDRKAPKGLPAVQEPDFGGAPLSRREHEVLVLLARGHTNREIAEQLGIGVKTVETYRGRLAIKLGLRTRAEYFKYALDAGLLTPTATPPGREPPKGGARA
jgi:two-component system response regulator NreC